MKDFAAQYFTPRSRTPDEFASAERMHYVTREALMKVHKILAQNHLVDPDVLDRTRRFLNTAYDAFVHGAYETMFLKMHEARRAMDVSEPWKFNTLIVRRNDAAASGWVFAGLRDSQTIMWTGNAQTAEVT